MMKASAGHMTSGVAPGLEAFVGEPAIAKPASVARAKRAQRRAEQREYRLMLGVFFALFLIIALATRVLPRGWRPFGGVSAKPLSVVGEARAAAHHITPFLFSR